MHGNLLTHVSVQRVIVLHGYVCVKFDKAGVVYTFRVSVGLYRATSVGD